MEISPRWIESDPPYRVPVLGDLLSEQSEEIQGQLEIKAHLPSSRLF